MWVPSSYKGVTERHAAREATRPNPGGNSAAPYLEIDASSEAELGMVRSCDMQLSTGPSSASDDASSRDTASRNANIGLAVSFFLERDAPSRLYKMTGPTLVSHISRWSDPFGLGFSMIDTELRHLSKQSIMRFALLQIGS